MLHCKPASNIALSFVDAEIGAEQFVSDELPQGRRWRMALRLAGDERGSVFDIRTKGYWTRHGSHHPHAAHNGTLVARSARSVAVLLYGVTKELWDVLQEYIMQLFQNRPSESREVTDFGLFLQTRWAYDCDRRTQNDVNDPRK